MPDSRQTDIAAAIRALAERHRVAYEPADIDDLAHHITRLSGDDVVFDETEWFLVALQRAGHLSSTFRIFCPGPYRMAQKMSSDAMNSRARSSDSMVRPNGPALTQRSFQSDQ
jgi:hypothetical protein